MVDAASTDVERAQSYIGCLVRLFTKSEIRYEGFVFYLDCNDRTIGLRNVKSFGTEGRRKDDPQVPPTERLFEYIYFRGSDLKDLHVLSSPSAQSTSALPDDPAIIKPRSPHLPAATMSLVTPSTFQAKNSDSNTQSRVEGNLLPQSVGVSVSQYSMIPAALSANVIQPSSTNYWHQFTGIPEGSCSQQQSFTIPQLPQGFMLANATQQPMQRICMNASLAGSASNITESPCPLLPPVYTGSLPLIATLPLPSSIQYSNASFAHLFSNFTINSTQNEAAGTVPTAMVNSSSEAVSSSGANPVVPPFTQTGHSLLRPHNPVIPRTVSSTTITSNSFDWKTSMTSHPGMQPGIVESSSSHHLKDGNNDAKIIVASASENTEEASPEPPKALNTEIHEPTSPSHYINRRHIQDRGDGIHESNRGHSQGRGGHGNLPNKGYQRYRSSDESDNAKIGAPSHAQHHIMNPGRGYAPNPTWHPHGNAGGHAFGGGSKPNPAWYPHHHVGGHAYEGGSESSLPVARFTEDFDFEKMNQMFNKEEVWDLLGKSKSAEGDDNEGNANDAIDEAEDVLAKPEQPIYSKDDFFDSISCRSLDAQSAGRGKMKMSEQRRMDVETFGKIQKPQKGHSVMRPQRGGSSRGLYHGRGSDTAERGRPANYWNRMTKN